MESGGVRAVFRAWALALLVLLVWGLVLYCERLPRPLPADAPATAFSSSRAETVLARLLGPERPHPASSAENEAVRGRILDEYARLGIKASTYRALGCNVSRRFPVMECGTVTDVVADALPGQGKAVLLLAHLDSVPAGPGAADDESGDATIFETIRALKARAGTRLHPVMALNTDGEEFGLLGAASFLDNPALRARVGAVVNVEARGNQGPSLLFQTSPGDGPLIDLYAGAVPRYATSSLYAVIYRFLPNDTDLTLFIRDGFLSYNFAFSGNVAHYHTALDRRANLDPATLQMHGDNLLGVADALTHTNFASLKGKDDIYITVLGRFLPRMSASWAMAVAIFAFVLLIASLWLERPQPIGWFGWIRAFAIVPLLVLGAAIAGSIFHEIASLVSGEPDPSYAHPWALRTALALGVWSVVVLVSRLAAPRAAALGVWLFIAFLAIVTAAFLPGLSPYFLFPALIASLIVFTQVFLPQPWAGPSSQAALIVAALPGLIIWLEVVATGESVMGLYLHPLFTVPAAFALAAFVPVLNGHPMGRAAWLGSSGISFAAGVAFAVVQGLLPAYSAIAPQRLDISYIEDATKHKAFWAATATAPLPPSLKAAAKFSDTAVQPYPFAFGGAYTAPAGALRFAPPTADVSVTENGGVRHVALALHGGDAQQVALAVPKAVWIKAIEIDGKVFEVPAAWAQSQFPSSIVLCTTSDCADKTITLEVLGKAPFDVTLVAQRYGLPADGARLVAARPDTAVVSQNGDTTVLINKVHVPAG